MRTSSPWHRPETGDTWIMGVLNCTPDSFSDGGLFTDKKRAVSHAISMYGAGAAIIDVGGESTRPGSKSIPLEVELHRVLPVIEALVSAGVYVSVDTSKSEVMRRALGAGARMVNDVTALTGDSNSMAVVAESSCDVCLMHMRGTPEKMQDDPHYDDVVAEIETFFQQRLEACVQAGVCESRIILDPGIGFGKSLQDNLMILASLYRFKKLGFPVLAGVSRKSFLAELTASPASDREIETAAAVTACVLAEVDILRVHEVLCQARVVKVASAFHRTLSKQSKVS
ncbi:MAG: dihydropteroate synthase [Mariprofundaceae bacterium]